MECTTSPHTHAPWNKGMLVVQKAPFKAQEDGAIRVRLQMENRARELAPFDPVLAQSDRQADQAQVVHHSRIETR